MIGLAGLIHSLGNVQSGDLAGSKNSENPSCGEDGDVEHGSNIEIILLYLRLCTLSFLSL